MRLSKSLRWMLLAAVLAGSVLGIVASVDERASRASAFDSAAIASGPAATEVVRPTAGPLIPVVTSATLIDARPLWSVTDPEQLLAVYQKGLSASADPMASQMSALVWGLCGFWTKQIYLPDEAYPAEHHRAMHAARAEMKRRCGAFVRIPRTDLDRNAKVLENLRVGPDSPTISLPRDPTPNEVARFKGRLRSMIAASDLNGFVWADGAIGDWLDHLSNDPHAGAKASSAFVGVGDTSAVGLLVLCELGFDCSKTNAVYLNICAMDGECVGSLQAYAGIGLTDAQRAKERATAEKLAATIRARDTQALGLD